MKDLLFGCGVTALLVTNALAQAPAPVEKEPHHQVRIDMLRLGVIELTLPPGEATVDHRHEYDVASIAVNDSTTREKSGDGPMSESRIRQAGSSAISEYAGMPGVHRVENAGSTPARFIEVQNFRTSGWQSSMPLEAPGTTLAKQSRSFLVYDVQLGPGTEMSAHDHVNPAIIILLSGAVVNQGGGGTEPAAFEGPGTIIYSAGMHTLRVKGNAPAHLAEVEIR
jgi:predicted metal-dependent enzyme (double-stranded beta helix superfamily)